ncbi:MAG: hypothetical protein IKU19_08950, partial [Clostridia bacterium]|nr:hypothetical protein [Clostridia bacterium]
HFPSRRGSSTDAVIKMSDGMEFICPRMNIGYDEFTNEIQAGAEVSILYHPWFYGYLVDELIIDGKEYVNLEESMDLISSNLNTLTVIIAICVCLTVCICTLMCVFGFRDEIKDCKKLIKHYKEKATHKKQK